MKSPLTFLLSLTFLFLFSGSVYGQEEVKKNLERLKVTKSCVRCTLVGEDLHGAKLKEADLTRADLSYANLSKAKMKNIKNLDVAVLCKTIMPYRGNARRGEGNRDCE